MARGKIVKRGKRGKTRKIGTNRIQYGKEKHGKEKGRDCGERKIDTVEKVR